MPKFRVLYHEVKSTKVAELEAKDRSDAVQMFYETCDPGAYADYEIELITVREITEATEEDAP